MRTRRALNVAKPANGIVLSEANGGLTGVIRSWQYSTSTTAADPGDGYFQFNHADPESGDTLYINDLDGQDGDLGGLLANIGVGTKVLIKSANAPAQFIIIELGTNTDNTGWHSIAYTVIAGAPDFLADETCAFEIGFAGAQGAAGTEYFTRVRAAATADVDISSELENGDSLDGVTLATGDFVLLPAQSASEENGIYVVPASGAASRASSFNSYDAHPGILVSVTEGSTNTDKVFQCTSNEGGTLDTTAIVFAEFVAGGDVSAAANITDNVLVRGDGGTKGVQETGIAVDDSDNMTGVGNIGFAGQLAFPATANDSSDANTLDDYEEGTWTPTLTFGGGSTGLTYSTQVGTYIKVGGTVILNGRIQLSAKGSSTGNAQVSGLPFSAVGTNWGLMTSFHGSMASISGLLRVNLSGSGGTFYQSNATGSPAATEANFTDSSLVVFNGQSGSVSL